MNHLRYHLWAHHACKAEESYERLIKYKAAHTKRLVSVAQSVSLHFLIKFISYLNILLRRHHIQSYYDHFCWVYKYVESIWVSSITLFSVRSIFRTQGHLLSAEHPALNSLTHNLATLSIYSAVDCLEFWVQGHAVNPPILKCPEPFFYLTAFGCCCTTYLICKLSAQSKIMPKIQYRINHILRTI